MASSIAFFDPNEAPTIIAYWRSRPFDSVSKDSTSSVRSWWRPIKIASKVCVKLCLSGSASFLRRKIFASSRGVVRRTSRRSRSKSASVSSAVISKIRLSPALSRFDIAARLSRRLGLARASIKICSPSGSFSKASVPAASIRS